MFVMFTCTPINKIYVLIKKINGFGLSSSLNPWNNKIIYDVLVNVAQNYYCIISYNKFSNFYLTTLLSLPSIRRGYLLFYSFQTEAFWLSIYLICDYVKQSKQLFIKQSNTCYYNIISMTNNLKSLFHSHIWYSSWLIIFILLMFVDHLLYNLGNV